MIKTFQQGRGPLPHSIVLACLFSVTHIVCANSFGKTNTDKDGLHIDTFTMNSEVKHYLKSFLSKD